MVGLVNISGNVGVVHWDMLVDFESEWPRARLADDPGWDTGVGIGRRFLREMVL